MNSGVRWKNIESTMRWVLILIPTDLRTILTKPFFPLRVLNKERVLSHPERGPSIHCDGVLYSLLTTHQNHSSEPLTTRRCSPAKLPIRSPSHAPAPPSCVCVGVGVDMTLPHCAVFHRDSKLLAAFEKPSKGEP